MKTHNRLLPVIMMILVVVPLASWADRKAASNKPSARPTSRTTTITRPSETTVSQTQQPLDQPVTIDPVTTSVLGEPVAAQQSALTSPMSGEQITWQVISGGGNRATSTNFIMSATVGQTATGPSASTNYKMNLGFWQNFTSSGCCVKEGDASHNGSVNVIDVTYLVNYLFKSGPAAPCKDEADVNDGGTVNVVDLSQLVGYLFKGGSVGVCP